jgi:tRNA(Ile)-lysidine synthase TilS/MesJ
VEGDLDVESHARATGQGLETAARDLRWAWLKAEAESSGAAIVATGHTLDDHTETVWLRLARGGGSGSLTPLPARQGMRWSPLIQTRREDLRTYLQTLGLPWREDETNSSDFTPRNRWRKLLNLMRQEAPSLDAHLWETHAQIEELRGFRDQWVSGWKGSRWDVGREPSRIFLRGAWTDPELRWTLEAAFRELSWNREADQLRGLTAWAVPHLSRRSRKTKTWGGWRLDSEPNGWVLHPIWQETTPSPVRLDVGENPREEP